MQYPLYLQTTEWTCGPSCVMMIRGAFEPKLPLTKELEMDIWNRTKTNNGNLLYTTQPRLAKYLMEYKYSTELMHTSKRGFTYTPGPIKKWSFKKRMDYYEGFVKEAVQAGMKHSIRSFNSRDLSIIVRDEKTAIIAFTSQHTQSQIFHHQLIYGSTDSTLLIQCPIVGERECTFDYFDKELSTQYGKGILIVRLP